MHSSPSTFLWVHVNQLPQLHVYWCSDACVRNVEIISSMTCNHILKICQYFHTSDCTQELEYGQTGYDKLCKVLILSTLWVIYSRSDIHFLKKVSVDGAMKKYTRHISICQYMPAKPIKCGMKAWMLCDSNTCIYVQISSVSKETE